ncbi:Transcription factor HES-3 [Microtus ochrogaster]|uniref:Transcription factor HES-3 n=1 Tax=Microtus ochrogaster TaxID=79684 RepID=A0A8J6KPD3_MICOH|nr:Transcription factor HES-3 [Microtus ochrogaster]
MEKKRRARINMSLEQLKSLLERHYSHQIRKRKLEKADILELSVKYMKSLQNSLQGLWPVPSGIDHPSGFQGCLPGVSQRLRREEDGSGLRCPLRSPRVLYRRSRTTTSVKLPNREPETRAWGVASLSGDTETIWGAPMVTAGTLSIGGLVGLQKNPRSHLRMWSM